jgi:hypothetical protein
LKVIWVIFGERLQLLLLSSRLLSLFFRWYSGMGEYKSSTHLGDQAQKQGLTCELCHLLEVSIIFI